MSDQIERWIKGEVVLNAYDNWGEFCNEVPGDINWVWNNTKLIDHTPTKRDPYVRCENGKLVSLANKEYYLSKGFDVETYTPNRSPIIDMFLKGG
jgi:hypothetical protein